MALKFFEDFNKLHKDDNKPAAKPDPEKVPDLTVDDMKKQFEDLKSELLGEIRKQQGVNTVDNSVDNSQKIDNNSSEPVNISKEGGNENASKSDL